MSNVPANKPIRRIVEKTLDARKPVVEFPVLIYSFCLPSLLDTTV